MKPIYTVRNKVELLDRSITKQDVVLDVGFWGQAKTAESPLWPHRLLRDRAREVWGIDLAYDEHAIPETDRHRYAKVAAESFSFDQKFDVIFAGDLIEHLVNPGLFIENVQRHLVPGGRLILTTPNAFNLFTLAGKLTRFEPVVNADHTCYFNTRTIQVLLEKCGMHIEQFGFMYTLDAAHAKSFKKRFLDVLYRVLSWFTPKYYETLVVTAIVGTRE